MLSSIPGNDTAAVAVLNPVELSSMYKSLSQSLGMKPHSSVLRIFESQPDLSTISLSNNYFGDRGLAAIIPVLRFTPVMVLDLHDTLLTYENVTMLSKELRNHPTLTSVDLTGNNFSLPSGRKLLEWVQECKTIREVKIDVVTPKYIFIQKQCLANSNVLVDVCACLTCGKGLLNPLENSESALLNRIAETLSLLRSSGDVIIPEVISSTDFNFIFRVISYALRAHDGVLVFCSRPCLLQFVSEMFDVLLHPKIEPRGKIARAAWEGYDLSKCMGSTIEKESQGGGGGGARRRSRGGAETQSGASSDPILAAIKEKEGWIECDFCSRSGTAVPNIYNTLINLLPNEVKIIAADGLRPSVFVRLVNKLCSIGDVSLCSRRCVKWLLRSGLTGGGGLLTYVMDATDLVLNEDVDLRIPPDDADFSVVDLDMPVTRDHGDSDMSAAFVLASVCEDLEGVPIDPYFAFGSGRSLGKQKVHHWGMDLRDACKAATTMGVLVAAKSPYTMSVGDAPRDVIADWNAWQAHPSFSAICKSAASRRKPHFFSLSGPFDNVFDNLRAALWTFRSTTRSVICGGKWKPHWMAAPGGVIPNDRCKGGIGAAVKIVGQKFINGQPHLVINPCLGSRRGLRGYFFANKAVINRYFRYGAYVFKEKSSVVHRSISTYANQDILDQLNSSTQYIIKNSKLAEETLMFLSSPSDRQHYYMVRHKFTDVMKAMPLEALFLYRGSSYHHTAHDSKILNHILHAYHGSFFSQIAFFWSNQVPSSVCNWFCELVCVLEEVRGNVRDAKETADGALRKQSMFPGRHSSTNTSSGTSPGIVSPASAFSSPLLRGNSSGQIKTEETIIIQTPHHTSSSIVPHSPHAQQAKVPRRPSSQKAPQRKKAGAVATFEPHVSGSVGGDLDFSNRRGSLSHWRINPTRPSTKSSEWIESCKDVAAGAQKALLSARYGLQRIVVNRIHPKGEGVSNIIYFTCAGFVLEYDYELKMAVREPVFIADHPLFSLLSCCEGLDCILYLDVFKSPIVICFAGSVWLKWDASRGVVMDGPLSVKENPPFPKLPTPFCDKIDCGVNVVSTTTSILFAGEFYLEYDLNTLTIVSGPTKLGEGMFEELPVEFHSGIESVALHPKYPQRCYLIRKDHVVLWDLHTSSLEHEPKPISEVFLDLPKPFFAGNLVDLLAHLSKSMLSMVPTDRIASVVPHTGPITVSWSSNWGMLRSGYPEELVSLDIDSRTPGGVLSFQGSFNYKAQSSAPTYVDFDIGTDSYIPFGYLQIMGTHTGGYATILCSPDSYTWLELGVVPMSSRIVHKWWSESHLCRYWRIMFKDLPVMYCLHRVLWFQTKWIPQHTPFEFITTADIAESCTVRVAAPRVLANPKVLLTAGASPTTPVASYPSGTRWTPKHAVIPINSKSSCLFVVGNRFVEWNFVAGRAVNTISYAFQVHPRFSRLPVPFSVVGLDSAVPIDPENNEVFIFCDESYILWNFELNQAMGPVYKLGETGEFAKLPAPFRNGIHAAMPLNRGEKLYLFHGDQYVVWSLREKIVVDGPSKLEHGVVEDSFPPNLLGPKEHFYAVVQSPANPNSRFFFVGDRWTEQVTTSLGRVINGPYNIRTGEHFSRLVRELGWCTTVDEGYLRFDLGDRPKMFCEVRVYTTVGIDSKATWLVQWSDDSLHWFTIGTHKQSEGWCRSNWRLEDVRHVSHRYWQLVAVDVGCSDVAVTYNAIQWGVLPSVVVTAPVSVYETTANISTNVFDSFYFPSDLTDTESRGITLDYGVENMVDFVGLTLEMDALHESGLFMLVVMCGAKASELEEIATFPIREKFIEGWWSPTLPRRFIRIEIRGKRSTKELVFKKLVFFEYVGPSMYRSDVAQVRKEYVDGITVLSNHTSTSAIKLTSSRAGTAIDLNCKSRIVPFTMLEIRTADRGSSVTNWDILASKDGTQWMQVSQMAQSNDKCTAWWPNAGAYQHWRLQCTGQFGGGWPKIEHLMWSVGKGELYQHKNMNQTPSSVPHEMVFVCSPNNTAALIRCALSCSTSAPLRVTIECYVTSLQRWRQVTVTDIQPGVPEHVILWQYCGPHYAWKIKCQPEYFTNILDGIWKAKWFCAATVTFAPAVFPATATTVGSLPNTFPANQWAHVLRWKLDVPSTFGKVKVRRPAHLEGVFDWSLYSSSDGIQWTFLAKHTQNGAVNSTTFTPCYPCVHWQMVCFTTQQQTIQSVEWQCPCPVASARQHPTLDDISQEELGALDSLHEAISQKLIGMFKSSHHESDKGNDLNLPHATSTIVGGATTTNKDPQLDNEASPDAVSLVSGVNPPGAGGVASSQESFSELHGAVLQQLRDIQKGVQKHIKDSRNTINLVGIELHKCFVEKFPNTCLASLTEILPLFSVKEIKVMKETAAHLNVLPKLDYRGPFFVETLGMTNMAALISIRWKQVPASLVHLNKFSTPSDELRVQGISSTPLLDNNNAVAMIAIEVKELPDWNVGKTFPNMVVAFQHLRIVLRKSLLLIASGSYWFGQKPPYLPFMSTTGWAFENPYPLQILRGINIVTRIDVNKCQGQAFNILNLMSMRETTQVCCVLNIAGMMAASAKLCFCTTFDADFGIPNMRWGPCYIHIDWLSTGWATMSFTGVFTWTVQGMPLTFNAYGELNYTNGTITVNGSCNNGVLSDVLGINDVDLHDVHALLTLKVDLDRNVIYRKEAVLFGRLNVKGYTDVQAQINMTHPSRPKLLCEAKVLTLDTLEKYTHLLCGSTVVTEQWAQRHPIQMVDCEIHFGNVTSTGRHVIVHGWVRVFGVEGRATAQLSQAGIHMSARLPELSLGSLWCKPMTSGTGASQTAPAVGFEFTSAESGTTMRVFTLLQLTALIETPVSIHFSATGCVADIEHTSSRVPWMVTTLHLTCDNAFESEFLISGTIQKRAAEEALHKALLDIPAMLEVVSVGLEFAFKLNHVSLVPFTLSRPVVCLRFVGVLLGSDFNVVAIVNPQNVGTFLPDVASIIVENCSSVVRHIWDEFIAGAARKHRHEDDSSLSNSQEDNNYDDLTSSFLSVSLLSNDSLQRFAVSMADVRDFRKKGGGGNNTYGGGSVNAPGGAMNFVHDAFDTTF